MAGTTPNRKSRKGPNQLPDHHNVKFKQQQYGRPFLSEGVLVSNDTGTPANGMASACFAAPPATEFDLNLPCGAGFPTCE